MTIVGNRRKRGILAELAAARYLQNNDIYLLARNYSCKIGELDIVGLDKEVLVFFEVRFRADSGYGTPAETVTRTKQKRIIRAAKCYLMANQELRNYPCRFDLLAVTQHRGKIHISWIKHAFQT